MNIFKKNSSLIIFTLIALVFSFGYIEFVALQGGLASAKNNTIFGEFGSMLGTFGFFALALVYARSVLKIIVCSDSLWKRLEPISFEDYNLKKISTKVLVFLNKTHAYFGVIAVALIFVHCFLTGSYQDNLLLQIVLALMMLEAASGFVLKLKYSPAQLKQKSYLIHRQFLIGILLVLFAFFGHLILGD
jgi:hypothetical protein